MVDVLTPEQRRRNMQAVRGQDTKPELVVRRIAHRLGLRFRLHRKDLPGRPDLVFPKLGVALFVHGCFWHLHRCRYGTVVPATNAAFWDTKRHENAARDRRKAAALRRAGWKVRVIWECETRTPERVERKLRTLVASRPGPITSVPTRHRPTRSRS